MAFPNEPVASAPRSGAFVSNARYFYRKVSTWLAAFNSALLTTLMAKSGLLFSFAAFLPFVPSHWRGFAAGVLAAVAALLAFVVPVLVAQIKQPKLAEKMADAEAGRQR